MRLVDCLRIKVLVSVAEGNTPLGVYRDTGLANAAHLFVLARVRFGRLRVLAVG